MRTVFIAMFAVGMACGSRADDEARGVKYHGSSEFTVTRMQQAGIQLYRTRTDSGRWRQQMTVHFTATLSHPLHTSSDRGQLFDEMWKVPAPVGWKYPSFSVLSKDDDCEIEMWIDWYCYEPVHRLRRGGRR